MNRDVFILFSALCAAAGALLYAALAFGLVLPPDHAYFGADIYDAYYYRLAEGRFDLPARLLGYEGHYTSNGTGFLYHFLAPLLTRAALAPFVALHRFPTAAFSIWLWATIGTGLYHVIIVQVVRKFADPMAGYRSAVWGVLIGAGLWISGPGLLLCANMALYHEPISIAYAAMALAVFLMVRSALFDMPPHRTLIPLALLAGILLQSRPHMAVGLYAGVCLMSGLALWRGARRSVMPVIASVLILGIFAGSFLAINALRFGSVTQAHGQFTQQTDANVGVQYGTVFWGQEEPDSPRARAFTEHGTFHPWRILPNLMVYLLDAPGLGRVFRYMHALITEPISGAGRIEGDPVGMLLLWSLWVATAGAGLILARPRISGGWRAMPLVATTGIAALLMLSYPTIAMRYRVDLWPFVITVCLLGFPGLMQRFTSGWLVDRRGLATGRRLVIVGVLFSAALVPRYRMSFTTSYDFFSSWTADHCAEMVTRRGLPASEIARICVDPDSVYPQDDAMRKTTGDP